ncbi:hypothetical protein RD792_014783 [Penstemon davidsonii]|uniref:F-ATPase gamma subunit n=1 Tax=Penstemon davidsonii TaxID=160366 RepID=A0ABR0CQE2_9LAMI|nr:hypothetical protein RD792_014783 [Penstemon davidsonii]
MAMAALRREGKRIAVPLISPNPINPLRSTLASSQEQTPFGVRSISTQIVRNRMKSVRNIQKITKAMKMVAASKLRAIQTKAENSRGLWQPFTALLGDTPSKVKGNRTHLKAVGSSSQLPHVEILKFETSNITSKCYLPVSHSVGPRDYFLHVICGYADVHYLSGAFVAFQLENWSYQWAINCPLGVDVKKNVIVTISSDKGLCGGINSTSVKTSRGLYKLNSGPEKECKYVVLGEKAKAQLVRDSKKNIQLTLTELQKNPLNYTQVAVLADDILKNVEYDALRIVFNKFQSVVSFVPTVSTVLSPEVVEREAEAGGTLGELDSYEIEGGETKSEVLQNLTEFQFSCVMFNAVMENACSEQGARMSAMDSSSRNAGDMLDRLTLTYNRTRQASITTELIEIISGASALEG